MKPLQYTRQQLADRLNVYLAMDDTGEWWAYEQKPLFIPETGAWDVYDDCSYETMINPDLIEITDPPTDAGKSLTSPRATEHTPRSPEHTPRVTEGEPR